MMAAVSGMGRSESPLRCDVIINAYTYRVHLVIFLIVLFIFASTACFVQPKYPKQSYEYDQNHHGI